MDRLDASNGLPKGAWRKGIGKSRQDYYCPKCHYIGQVLLPRRADLISALYAIAADHETHCPNCNAIPTELRVRAPQCTNEEWNKLTSY